MTRRGGDDDGSLELLLDTICNTFGGVLFISLLVVILLNATSEDAAMTPPDEADQAQLMQWETRLARTNKDLQTLQAAIQEQRANEEYIVDPEALEMMKQMRESLEQSAQLMERKNGNLDDIAKSQDEVNDIARRLAQWRDARRNAQENLEAIERQLQQEIRSRTRAAKLPKGRLTNKQEVAMFLRNGRLCCLANPDEFVEQRDEEGRPFVEPKPGAGVLVDLQGRNQRDIDAALDEFDPDQRYLAIIVWPDSFQQFAIVKDRIVSKGFEYRLEPLPEGEKVHVGERPENVRVQ